jgi:hypothetical protein
MKETTVAYRNLLAKMQSKGISVGQVGQCMRCNRDTVTRRLARKTPLSLADAARIRRKLFPECDIEYLFEEDVAGDPPEN